MHSNSTPSGGGETRLFEATGSFGQTDGATSYPDDLGPKRRELPTTFQKCPQSSENRPSAARDEKGRVNRCQARGQSPSKPNCKVRESAEHKAVRKMEEGRRIADHVRNAAKRQANPLAEREALLIDRCNGCENFWIGKDFEILTGDPASPEGANVEYWDGHGRFFYCGNRLCPGCSEKMRRRSRRTATEALKAHKQRVGYNWRLVTLTQPKLVVSITESMALIRRAWTLLYKREFWRQHVESGVLGMEFEATERAAGYHTHVHILASSRFIPVERLIEEWETCVTKAHSECEAAAVDHCKHCGRTRDAHAAHDDGHAFRLNASVSVRLVRPKPGSSAVVTMKEALNEVLKYITKPKTWLSMAEDALVECATLQRWPRMFEIFGSLKSGSTSRADTILDTKDITHGGNGEPRNQKQRAKARRLHGLRALIRKTAISFEQLEQEIIKRIKAASFFRMQQLQRLYPFVRFFTIQDYLVEGDLLDPILKPVLRAA